MAEDLERQEAFLEKNIKCNMLRRKSLFLIYYEICYKVNLLSAQIIKQTNLCLKGQTLQSWEYSKVGVLNLAEFNEN